MKLKLIQKGIILVCLPLVFELLFVGFLAVQVYQVELEIKRESRAKKILDSCAQLSQLYLDVSESIFAYRYKDDPDSSQRYQKALHDISANQAELMKLANESTEFAGSFREANRAIAIAMAEDLEPILDLMLKRHSLVQMTNASSFDTELDLQLLDEFDSHQVSLQNRSKQFLALVNSFTQSARRVQAASPEKQRDLREKQKMILLLGLSLNVVLTIFLGFFFGRSISTRLFALGDNTRRLSAGLPLSPPISGSDEIAELDRVFHEMVQTLEQTREREKSLEQVKEQLLEMVAHDLRTPLTSAYLSHAVLLNDMSSKLPDEAQQLIRISEKSLARLVELVDNFLDFQKLQSGVFHICNGQIHLRVLLENCLEQLGSLLEHYRLNVELPLEDVEFEGDELALTRVIINLLSNAIKFSPEGETIRILYKECERSIRISICDAGPGIPDELKSSLFERFKQAHTAESKKTMGTGLGLAICKMIVEHHGGTIGVEDGPDGKGSIFWFEISKTQNVVSR